MGWPEVARNGRKIKKIPVTHGGRRRRFAGPIRARPAAVGREILPSGSSGCGKPPRPARVALWCPVVPPLVQSPQLANGQNDPTRIHKFGELL